MRKVHDQLFNRRSFEPRLKHVRVSCAVGHFAPLMHLIIYSFPIRARSPFTTELYYRADVKLPIRSIQEANSCWFPHLPSVQLLIHLVDLKNCAVNATQMYILPRRSAPADGVRRVVLLIRLVDL
jgi:hypothetical protein